MISGSAPAAAIGTWIGPYQVVGWIGAGGMGEVYRARDPRLGRDVAIKLIPRALATEPGRVHRFEQEARAAGQISHPNILAVYDSGSHDGAPYVVSELLVGETLRDRLRAGLLPVRKVVDYARQIADGLGAAHDKGIVHRDLKPENLFITDDGRVKILDFGIAKLTQPTERPGGQESSGLETEVGAAIGTAGYMSPEQIRGEDVDGRSDIFSFGAILYEMLEGRAAFTRATSADTMAAILGESAPLTRVPPALERVLERCLEKTREARFQAARDVAFSLEDVSTRIDSRRGTALSWRPPPLFYWVAAALTLMVAAVALGTLRRSPSPQSSPASVRLNVELSPGLSLAPLNTQFGGAATLSPDGAVMAFVAQKGETSTPQLYVRRLADQQLDATPLSGTDNALSPFFSPDGHWIGFFADLKLKKVAVTGGAPVTLADALSNRGGVWSDDGTIIFTPDQKPGTPMLRVSSAGGSTEPVAPPGEGEIFQFWPETLPGGKAVLYTTGTIAGAYNNASLVVRALPGGTPKIVQSGGYHGRYLASGHLIFVHDGTLFAVPFDPERLEETGQAVPVLEGVRSNSITGGAQFAVSSSGTLVYVPGPSTGGGMPVEWMDREGTTTALKQTRANWFNVSFAPDGRRLAMDIRDEQAGIWVYELAQDKLTRVTSDDGLDEKPVWSPDGRRIAFASTRADKSTENLYLQRADGSGPAQRLTESRNPQRPVSWHPSGKYLAFEETNPQTSVDIMILPLTGDDVSGWTVRTPAPLLNGPAIEFDPTFSPDGRWLAYGSNESGRTEIYVQPFPGPGGRWRISSDGGMLPTWSQTGRELLFAFDGQIMTVRYSVDGDTFIPEKPQPWPGGRFVTRGQNRMFDLHPDGKRIALAHSAVTPDLARPNKIVFIFNFFDELRRVVAARGH